MTQLKKMLTTILGIIYVVILITSVIGLVYLTKFTFEAKKHNDGYVIDNFSTTELDFCKATIILDWISIGLGILIIILSKIFS